MIGDQHAKLKVTVVPDDYRNQVSTILKDYAKRANLKGFRKGKVPVSVVRRMYGKGIVYEELNKIVSKSLGEYLDETKLPIVGEPLPVSLVDDFDENGERDYEFEFELGLAPEFEIEYGLVGESPLYNVTVDDATLEKEVETLQNTYGPMTNPDESQEGDILFGKLSEIDADGNVVEDGYQKMYTLNPDRVPGEELVKKMGGGVKPDETLEVSMEEVARNDNELRKLWETNVQGEKVRDISDEELEAIKGKKFQFEVRKINRIEKMEIGQELFDKAFGEDEVSTEEEFRDRLKGDMVKFFERESLRYYRTKAIKALIEGMSLPLPDEFLKRWLVQTREKVTEENIEDLYESYSRSLRWRLIIEKMQEENPEVKVEEADMRAKAEEQVVAQFGAMLGDADPERLDTFVSYFMNDEKLSGRMFDELVEEKVFKHLGEKNPAASEEITATEFMELLKNED